MLCPECEGSIHRSHARGFKENLVRSLTSYKAYRCRECGWRGWLAGNLSGVQTAARKNTIHTVIGFLATLFILIIALYLVRL